MAENEAQRLHCRMLQTREQPVWLRIKLKCYTVECCRRSAGCVAENEAQRLCCRMLHTGEQAVWLRMKLKRHAVECCRLESRLCG